MEYHIFTHCFSPDRQELLVHALKQIIIPLNNIATHFRENHNSQIRVTRLIQYLLLLIIKKIFALDNALTFNLLVSKPLDPLYLFFLSIENPIPGKSTISRQLPHLETKYKKKLQNLAQSVQDAYEMANGNLHRNRYQAYFGQNNHQSTPPPEIFSGLFLPSELFPALTIEERGYLLPFLTLKIYAQSQRISGIPEIIGFVKKVQWEQDQFHFKNAAAVGFLTGPPERHAFYDAFRRIEENISILDQFIDRILIRNGLHDLAVTSFDGTNIPVDARDQSGSIGTGSRGSFYGQKAALSVGGNCLPIGMTLDQGRVADSTLFPQLLPNLMNLSTTSGEILWATTLDAGFDQIPILDSLEKNEIIGLVDLNPKNSPVLTQLKQKATELRELSKIALKKVNLSNRSSWRIRLKKIGLQSGGSMSFKTKKRQFWDVIHLEALNIRRKGLTSPERRKESRIRKELMQMRKEIKKTGKKSEQRRASSVLAHGTIEWFIVYGIRGQNEGINGILKKKDNLIGDGQHTTWIYGQSKLKNHIGSILTELKCIAWIHYVITGNKMHSLQLIHNWDHISTSFWCIKITIFCRKTPHCI